ncbi:unnamed protein product [Phaeothamnion confervicola]
MAAIAFTGTISWDFIDVENRNIIAGEDIAANQVVYYDPTTGKALKASANTTGKKTPRGIALDTVKAGQPVTVVRRGEIAGPILSGNFGTLVYLADTAGGLDTVASATTTVPVGYVVPDSKRVPEKALFVDFTGLTIYG